MMKDYLVLISCVCFLIFLIPGRFRKYFAIVGWLGITGYLFTGLPEYVALNNFMYPTIAILSIPFLYVTIRHLIREDQHTMQLSTAAAVAFLIYAPFAYIQPIGEWLIAVVVGQTSWMLTILGYPVTHQAWNMLARNGFQTEIILACTGIQSIAIMLGVASSVKTTARQKILAFLLVFPTIYLLNILRNAFVIMAYTEQWFPYLPEIAGNGEYGYESFFWAHNVVCELAALALLIGIAYGLFIIIPQLGRFADDLYRLYSGDLLNAIRPLNRNGR